ncbi:MAG: methionyl-tRNA formyltransferase [Bacteroidota bacterium]
MKNSLNIVFMGTPEFAVSILDALFQSTHKIVGAVTATDKPAGRGQQLKGSAVKEYAIEKGLNLLQPESLKDTDFLSELQKLNADLFVVVAFRMLPEAVWSMPPKGTINLHASLLPQYRGAAPINWALINGEKKTGVTTFFIDKEIDTGKVIDQLETEISENMTVGELYKDLMKLGSSLTVQTVTHIAEGKIEPKKQEDLIVSELKHAPKIFKNDCEIQWVKTMVQNHNLVRGLSPYPGAWTKIYNLKKQEWVNFKILGSEKSELKVKNSQNLGLNERGILFPCCDFYLIVSELQPEGKRKMHFKEFLAGHKLEDWALKMP